MFWPRKEKRFTPKKRQLRRIRDSIILNNRACSEVLAARCGVMAIAGVWLEDSCTEK